MTQVVAWKSYGTISVYNVSNEACAKKFIDEVNDCLQFGYQDIPKFRTVNQLVFWVNNNCYDDDSFETMQLTTLIEEK